MSVTATNLRMTIAGLPGIWAIPMANTAAMNVQALKNLLAAQLTAMGAAQAATIANLNVAGAAQHVQIGNLNNQLAQQASEIQSLYRAMKLGGAGLTFAAVIGNLLYNYLIGSLVAPGAPVADRAKMDAVCKKALQECHSGLMTNKGLLDQCRELLPTLKESREEATAEWNDCLDKLEACEKAGNSTTAPAEKK